MNRDVISTIPFLSAVDPGFISHVFSIMTPSYALPNEIILQVGPGLARYPCVHVCTSRVFLF